MKENEEPAEPTTTTPSMSASATPTPTSNESRSTYKGNRRGNLRRGNEGGTRGSEQKDFKGETPELNAVLCLVKILQDIVLQNVLELFESDTLVQSFCNKSEDSI